MLNHIIKVDLHIHSKASEYKEDPSIVADSDIEHLDVLFDALDKNNIQLFSISDHNVLDANLYNAIEDKIAKRDSTRYLSLGVIPGIEFDVAFDNNKKPCHIMTYFDTQGNRDSYKKIEDATKRSDLSRDFKYNRTEFESILRKIGLPVLLFAYQRKAPDNQSGGKNSVSDAVDDFWELFDIDYINGIDLQKPNVEGILRGDLTKREKSIDKHVAMLMASDCHQWSAYPAHHKGHGKTNVEFSSVKCLPTFKGLLMAVTSPETRFSRIENESAGIASFTFGSSPSTIDLSPGLNAIIGENGSGKSTLLDFLAGCKLKENEKKIIHKNKLSPDTKKEINKDKIIYIGQSELIEQYHHGNLIDSDLFFGCFIDKINTQDFERLINNYVSEVTSAMEEKIQNNLILSESGEKITLMPSQTTYFVQIKKGLLKIDETAEVKKRRDTLSSIKKSINEEIRSDYYSVHKELKDKLQKALKYISSIYNEVNKEYQKQINLSEVKNQIVSEIEEYNDKLRNRTTSHDKEQQKYQEKVERLKNEIIKRVKATNKSNQTIPVFPIEQIDKEMKTDDKYINTKRDNGYVFISSPQFSQELSELETSLCKALFNSEISTFSDLNKITNKEKWIRAVYKVTDSKQLRNTIDAHLRQWLENETKLCREIKKQTGEKIESGSTLGEQSLVYYQVITDSPESDIIFIFDQPEDNISNNKIASSLNTALDKLRDKNQVIFVTHNPLMVVNLDVDNVICMEGIKNRRTGEFEFQIKSSGCLEDGDILKTIESQMDGGKAAVEERIKRYGH